MEYKRAFELAETMTTTYSKNAQIFLTTHSPAFIDLSGQDQSIYMAKRENADTVFKHLNSARKQRVSIDDPFMLVADELGHIRLMTELHDKLQKRLADAEETAKNLAATLSEVESLNVPVVLTEGKTDVLILKEAWRRLRTGDPPFAIKSCNVLSEEDKNDAAGAAQLGICLRSIMADHHHTVIGLFDRDSDGRKAWALDANFTKFKSFDDVKVSKNSKAYAILLPVPENNPELAKSDHHCVEFMFPLEALHKKEEGKGLLLKGIPVETRCGNTVIHKIAGTEVWQMIVQDGKKWFAEKVVPSLPDDDFAAFDQIFKLIEATLQAKEKEHSLQPTGTEPDLIDEEASEISSEVHIYPSFSIGDRVCHVKFGNGNISWIDGNKLTIDFDQAGQKRVLEGFVERA